MIEPINFDQPCDLVGITAMTFKANRAYEIAMKFKSRGIPVVMGGIHASMCPDEAVRYVDAVVVGEADELWPKILTDFEKGRLLPRYTVAEFPDISNLPPPRHDLTLCDNYFAFFLQTTRGCPYNCSFCTVTQMNGRKLRKKIPEQVVKEVESLLPLRKSPFTILDAMDGGKKKKLVTNSIFFIDDNFAIDREHAVAVCKALERFQKEKGLVARSQNI